MRQLFDCWLTCRIRCCAAWWLGELVLPPEEEPADEIEHIEDLREPSEEGDEGGE